MDYFLPVKTPFALAAAYRLRGDTRSPIAFLEAAICYEPDEAATPDAVNC